MTHSSAVIFGEIDLSKVRGLLFDVDGTLSDTDDHMINRINRLIKPVTRLFKNNDSRRFARWMVMSAETPANFLYSMADRLGLDAALAILYDRSSRKRHERTPLHERFWIVPGVKAMLEYFSGQLPMAVVSARDQRTTLHFLEYFDLLPYFEVIVTAQTCKRTKPFADPVVYAAEQLQLQPEHCLMIGDTIVDVQAGKSAGAQTVAVLCGFGTQRELEKAGADLIIPSTADLKQILDLDHPLNE